MANGCSENGQATGPCPETNSWYLITNTVVPIQSRSLTEQPLGPKGIEMTDTILTTEVKDEITDLIAGYFDVYRSVAEGLTDAIVSLLEQRTSCLRPE
jgi:hypothetical protein